MTKQTKEQENDLGADAAADASACLIDATQRSHADPKVIDGGWGYAREEPDAVFIPVVMATMEHSLGRVLAELYALTNQTRMIFSAVLDADKFRPHLRNIVREWDEYVPELEDESHCIEIRYEPPKCAWCDGGGADVDAEPVQTGAHSTSWVGSISKCQSCGGTGLKYGNEMQAVSEASGSVPSEAPKSKAEGER